MIGFHCPPPYPILLQKCWQKDLEVAGDLFLNSQNPCELLVKGFLSESAWDSILIDPTGTGYTQMTMTAYGFDNLAVQWSLSLWY